MKIKKIVLLLILLPIVFLHAKNLYQYVVNWPAGYDTTGKHWVVYNLYTPKIDFLSDTSIGSNTAYNAAENTIAWLANLDNFQSSSPPWDIGDTIVVLGSMDTAYISDPSGYGDNPNHTGFYWIYSDTVIMATPERWLPDDTLRVLPQPFVPQPIAAQLSDNIEIHITNPQETRRPDQTTYDVLGYWLWADTTGTGTPNRFDMEVKFIPVSGGPGETTIDSHPIAGNYELGQWVYWAYKLVAGPDTTTKGSRQTCPGYATYYFSQNSNLVEIGGGGIEESQIPSPKSQFPILEVCPNPFSEKTVIRYSISDTGARKGEANQNISESVGSVSGNQQSAITIFDVSGRLVKTFSLPTSCFLLPTVITWDGTDDEGNCLSQGIYFLILKSKYGIEVKKVCKLK